MYQEKQVLPKIQHQMSLISKELKLNKRNALSRNITKYNGVQPECPECLPTTDPCSVKRCQSNHVYPSSNIKYVWSIGSG